MVIRAQMLLYNLHALFKAIINQIQMLIWGQGGRLFTTPPWLCSERGGPQHRLQLQLRGFAAGRDAGARKGCQRWTMGTSIPVHCQISQVRMRACQRRGTQPGLERPAEAARRSRRAPGISTIRSEFAPSPRGAGRGTALLRAWGRGGLPPVLCGLPLPALGPGGLGWGLAKMPLFCWVCSAKEEESVCGLSRLMERSAFYCSLALA